MYIHTTSLTPQVCPGPTHRCGPRDSVPTWPNSLYYSPALRQPHVSAFPVGHVSSAFFEHYGRVASSREVVNVADYDQLRIVYVYIRFIRKNHR